MLSLRKLLLWKKMSHSDSENVVLCLLAKCCKDSIFAVADKSFISFNDAWNARALTIRDRFWFYFSKLI